MYVAVPPHLLDLEALLLLAITTLLLVDDGGVGHLDVGHVRVWDALVVRRFRDKYQMKISFR